MSSWSKKRHYQSKKRQAEERVKQFEQQAKDQQRMYRLAEAPMDDPFTPPKFASIEEAQQWMKEREETAREPTQEEIMQELLDKMSGAAATRIFTQSPHATTTATATVGQPNISFTTNTATPGQFYTYGAGTP